MMLETVLKIIGWVMVVGPVMLFVIISGHLIIGASKDDDMIKAIAMLFVSIFAIGALMLALAYFTDILATRL